MTIRGAVSGPFVYPYPSFYPSCFLLSVRNPVQKSTCEEMIVPISFNLYCKKDLPLLVYIVVPIIVKNSPCEWPLIFFYQPGKEVVIRFLASSDSWPPVDEGHTETFTCGTHRCCPIEHPFQWKGGKMQWKVPKHRVQDQSFSRGELDEKYCFLRLSAYGDDSGASMLSVERGMT